MSRRAVVYTDGACPNQGLSGARAGYGVFWGDGHQNNRSGAVDGIQDTNRAETHAAEQAIKTAKDQGFDSITIRTDSQSVRDAIANSSNFQTSSAETRDLVQSINDMKRGGIEVNVETVRAHSGNHGNDKAHKLATAGAKMGGN